MPAQTEYTDPELLNLLKDHKEEAIDILFRRYYSYVCKSAYRIIPDGNLVEDLAQDVFFELWKKRDQLKINTSVKAYLKRAVINKALNYIRDKKMKFDDHEKFPEAISKGASAQEIMEESEMEKVIHAAIDRLPERCRIVFCLSRFEEMTYQQIADKLDISIKTVENQISKALKYLRSELRKP